MSSLMLLIPLSLLVMLLAVGIFFWAVRSGQYDDLESPAWRVVLDDDRQPAGSPERANSQGSEDGADACCETDPEDSQ